MKNSTELTNEDYREILQTNAEEKRLHDLSNEILSNTVLKCSNCSEHLKILKDYSIRCGNLSCKLFMVMTSGSQLLFDF